MEWLLLVPYLALIFIWSERDYRHYLLSGFYLGYVLYLWFGMALPTHPRLGLFYFALPSIGFLAFLFPDMVAGQPSSLVRAIGIACIAIPWVGLLFLF
ncbi:hypothetical protein L4D06_19675 [Enterovibrio makurazakiensis]|uniref:Uncharacterized protein n=1 Tax=Enterovibrio gelatinilyticus TaxID=2899819 RepID=A0ABT5R0W1_9GAMM|nr:hypothetical protein [Enterovibrio sp. ZSDZ42]MDD1793912.1 hypothetical protein [Enterovibrio sp. ZSDZ42]